MKLYRFKIEFYADEELEVEHGLVMATSLTSAVNQVSCAFVREDEVQSVKVELFYPPDDSGVLLFSKDLLNAMEKEVVW